MTTTAVPPIKCQGIKTKLVGAIRHAVGPSLMGRWIEPFCGSCVVALNLRPPLALLTDVNEHIIQLYQDIQTQKLTSGAVREFLTAEGSRLKEEGESVFYEIRERFNNAPNSFDFLFLNRACFNGVMRFNRKGRFNVPFCRKPERFAPAYITKIVNQIKYFAAMLQTVDWTFQVADFRNTLQSVAASDFVYVDPPYAGRHVDYYTSWNETDERELQTRLKELPSRFLLSTWESNEFRTNASIAEQWSEAKYSKAMIEHFYHVGPQEELRHPMREALIANFPITSLEARQRPEQLDLFS